MTPQDAYESMPKKIKVGMNSYTVELVDSIDEDGSLGYMHPDKQTIAIIKNIPTSARLAGTLFHEILHAIWDERALGKRPNEEQVVLAYEAGIMALFQDNPKLLSWLKKGLK